MTVQDLIENLNEAISNGEVDPTDHIHLIKADGKLIPLNVYNEGQRQITGAFGHVEIWADNFVIATTQK